MRTERKSPTRAGGKSGDFVRDLYSGISFGLRPPGPEACFVYQEPPGTPCSRRRSAPVERNQQNESRQSNLIRLLQKEKREVANLLPAPSRSVADGVTPGGPGRAADQGAKNLLGRPCRYYGPGQTDMTIERDFGRCSRARLDLVQLRPDSSEESGTIVKYKYYTVGIIAYIYNNTKHR
jgi:hypothetical protein